MENENKQFDNNMGQTSEIKEQLDDWKGKVDSDDYEDLMHEVSEQGTAPDNDSDDERS